MKRTLKFVRSISLFLGIDFGLPKAQLKPDGGERPAAPASAQIGGTR